QEVIVAFEEGDPDQPLIVGSVYNAEQIPPFELDTDKTQSGIKTRSSKSGNAENYNEICFEDKKGEELLYIRAEKDHIVAVEHDEYHWAGNDRITTVEGNEQVMIEKGNRDVSIDMGNETLTIKLGNQATKLDAGKSETEAMQSIELK